MYNWLLFFCILVIVTVITVLIFQQFQYKAHIERKLEDLVAQINNASLYAYNFDKNQDENLQNVDSSVLEMSNAVKQLKNNIESIQRKTHDIDDIRNKALKTSADLQLGKHVLYSQDGQWLRLKPIDTSEERTNGLYTDKIYVQTSSEMKGNTVADSMNITNGLTIKGGRSSLNPRGLPTMLPYIDDINYIRGDTDVAGNLKVLGDVSVNNGKKLCIGDTCVSEKAFKVLAQYDV